MPHDVQSMIFVGAPPWHGLGTPLPRNASYDEIVAAAGFYKVREQPVYVPGRSEAVKDVKALVRADTNAVLAVVGARYEVVQASDVARTLVEAAGGVRAMFHTAGTLGPDGARFWLLGELPGPIKVRGDPSEIRRYVLGTSAHDSSSPVVIQNCATRVVCANTLGVALGEKTSARWTIRHTRSAPDRLREAARGFREIVLGYERFAQMANTLAITRFSDTQMRSSVDRVMPVPKDDADHSKLETGRAKVLELFETGRGMNGIRGTAWAAWQAFTEFSDHHRQLRGAKSAPAKKRFESIWFGTGAGLKRRALEAVAGEARVALAA